MRRGRGSWKQTTPDPDMDEEGEDDVGACSRGTPGPAAPDDGGDVEHVSGDEYSNVCCFVWLEKTRNSRRGERRMTSRRLHSSTKL